ncbi:hypothetical protein BJX65DRAFT_306247 [Aspergillus insuetus]
MAHGWIDGKPPCSLARDHPAAFCSSLLSLTKRLYDGLKADGKIIDSGGYNLVAALYVPNAGPRHDSIARLQAVGCRLHQTPGIHSACMRRMACCTTLGLGRHMWDIPSEIFLGPYNNRRIHQIFATNITYPWTVCFAKLSILLLYKRLFPVGRERIAIWAGLVLVTVLYVGLGQALAVLIQISIGIIVACVCTFPKFIQRMRELQVVDRVSRALLER